MGDRGEPLGLGSDPGEAVAASLTALDEELQDEHAGPWVLVDVTVVAAEARAHPVIGTGVSFAGDAPTFVTQLGGILAPGESPRLQRAPRAPFAAAHVAGSGLLLVNPVVLAALEPDPARPIELIAPLTTAPVAVEPPRPRPAKTEPLPTPIEPLAGPGNPYAFYGSVGECAAAEQDRCQACLADLELQARDPRHHRRQSGVHDARGQWRRGLLAPLHQLCAGDCHSLGLRDDQRLDVRAGDLGRQSAGRDQRQPGFSLDAGLPVGARHLPRRALRRALADLSDPGQRRRPDDHPAAAAGRDGGVRQLQQQLRLQLLAAMQRLHRRQLLLAELPERQLLVGELLQDLGLVGLGLQHWLLVVDVERRLGLREHQLRLVDLVELGVRIGLLVVVELQRFELRRVRLVILVELELQLLGQRLEVRRGRDRAAAAPAHRGGRDLRLGRLAARRARRVAPARAPSGDLARRPAVRPILVDLLARWLGYPVADLVAPSYFTMAAISILVGAVLLVRRARREGDDVAAILAALAWGYAAAIGCGILCPIVADLADQVISGHLVGLRWAGMVAYGGFVGGFVAAGMSLRRTRTVSFARFADLAAAPVGLAIAFVRTGCFIAGCDYGKVTSLPWAIRFPAGSPAFVDQVQAGLLPATRTASLPVHPTQLYEVALGLAIFVVVGRLGKLRLRAGSQFLAATAMYAFGRGVVEVFRGDASRGLWGPLSTSQVIGILVLAGCALVLVRTRAVAVTAAAALAFIICALSPSRVHADEAVATTATVENNGFDFGLGVGALSPLNRRNGQVPQLFALSVLGTYTLAAPWGIGVMYEDATNSVAIQTTFAGLVSYRPALADNDRRRVSPRSRGDLGQLSRRQLLGRPCLRLPDLGGRGVDVPAQPVT